jgi:hypothetical protein
MASILGGDPTSIAYQHGYEQGLEGREFRNPCVGNPSATNNHYFGFLKGKADRTGEAYDWTKAEAA